ncbi:MAG TPA: hypothetical protein VKR61_24805 [Bryobacteraceae bacterium]|nr:hypothetical protein [Bryobacteraceae bacterium]
MAGGALVSSAPAQPTVTQVSNAASQSLVPLPNSAIAAGSLFSIYGTGFGLPASTCVTNYYGCYWKPYPLPTSIQGTSVSVTVGGTTLPAYIEYAATGGIQSQINAVLPSNTPAGAGTLTITSNGATSAAFPITVTAHSFGIFTWNSAGTGPGIMTNAVTNQLFLPFPSGEAGPSKPGDYVTIWGTGLGPVDAGGEASGAPAQINLCASASSCPVTVWIAGQQATVVYAGRSGFTAVDQIDIILPASAGGCYVQVAVQYGPAISNFASIPADGEGASCHDADGTNFNDIVPALGLGSANVAVVGLLSNLVTLDIPGQGPIAWDYDTVVGQVGVFSPLAVESFQGFVPAPSVGNCRVSPFLKSPPPVDPVLSSVQELHAGSMSVTGPNGTLGVSQNNGYFQLVGGEDITDVKTGCPSSSGNACAPFFLDTNGWNTPAWVYSILPGVYGVSFGGGLDVYHFSMGIEVVAAAASFKWTNQDSIGTSISRGSPLTIQWTGGDPNGFVDITMISSTLASGAPQDNTPGILAECVAAAGPGTFTVPAYVLQSLPSTAGSQADVPPGELLVGPVSAPIAAAVLPQPPRGLDAAYTFYRFLSGTSVTWQ